jgi:23S rRNA pseudouridine1911/1915/1917 synthase
MAHVRAPLVGDSVYGGRPRLPNQPSERLRLLLQGFGRQALHATRLAFTHPVSGEPVSFASGLAPDFRDLLAALREDAAGAHA